MGLTSQFYLATPALTIPDKERQILTAAEVLFTTRRFHEVTMDDVCREAGVGKGTIYRYFKDKDDLFQRLITSGAEELCEILQSESAASDPFAHQLRRVVGRLRQAMQRKHDLFRLMQSEETRKIAFNEATRAQWKQRRKVLLEATAAFLKRGVENKALRDDIAPEALATVLLGMLRSLTWHGEPLPDGEESTSLLTDLFLRGAAVASEPKSR